MHVFQYTDAKVVKAACERYGFDWNKHMTMCDKLILKEYTGLSLSLVCRALTNIRKGIK